MYLIFYFKYRIFWLNSYIFADRKQQLLYIGEWDLIVVRADSIGLFIEDQASSRSYELVNWLLPHLPSVSSTDDTQEDWERETTCWRRDGRRGEEPNHTTARKPGPLLIIRYSQSLWVTPSDYWCRSRNSPVPVFKTSYGRKNRFLESNSKHACIYETESAMPHKCLFLKLESTSLLGPPSPPPENQFHDGIGSHKESITWNRCLASL